MLHSKQATTLFIIEGIRRYSVFAKIAEGTNFLYPRLVFVVERKTSLLVVVSCCWLYLLFLLFLLLPLPSFCPVCLQKKFFCPVCLQKKVRLFRLSSKRKSYVLSVLFDFCQVDAVVLFYLCHDEGALDGADGLDVAEFREYELLVLFHIACANL